MRGDTVYRIYGVHRGRAKDSYFGTFRTVEEARAEIARLHAKEMHGRNWAAQYHDQGFVIREARVETDFVIPSLPAPRDRYFVRATRQQHDDGSWDTASVDVFRRVLQGDGSVLVGSFDRNYGMLGTFEPFRQGGRELALIARHYTKTAVLDLATGEVIAEEDEEFYPDGSPCAGFCPVGFYVPDWWDLNDDSIIPGSEYWNADHEWPVGDFGFVWGCHWGDDSSWKVQYLDLSRVAEGVIRRDDRFGYIELATAGYVPPCINPKEGPPGERSRPPSFIRVWRHAGRTEVRFAAELKFDLASGRLDEAQREGFTRRAAADDGATKT